MSRSYKKQPFAAITCCESAKRDKQIAHRSERRAQKKALRIALLNEALEDYLPLHIYECPNNDVWGWGRDGNQLYQGLDARDFYNYVCAHNAPSSCRYGDERWTCWPPLWYVEMMRK